MVQLHPAIIDMAQHIKSCQICQERKLPWKEHTCQKGKKLHFDLPSHGQCCTSRCEDLCDDNI